MSKENTVVLTANSSNCDGVLYLKEQVEEEEEDKEKEESKSKISYFVHRKDLDK